MEQAEDDGPAARTDVDDGRRRPFGSGDDSLDEHFRFRPGNEDVFTDLEIEAHEGLGTQDVGYRQAVSPLFDHRPVGGQFFTVHGFVIMGVQVDALFMQDMGQEDFRIEARRIDAFAGKVLLRPLQQGTDSPNLIHLRLLSSIPPGGLRPGPG